MPVQALTTSVPSTTSTSGAQYQYTYTQEFGEQGGEVDECESSSLGNYGGYTETFCAGKTAILTTAPPKPKATVLVGQQTQNVGTLTGAALSTSVSSAVAELCPTPSAAGQVTNCTADHVDIGDIAYLDSSHALQKGKLSVYMENSWYNETGIRQGMIDAIAQVAMSSANATNCHDESHRFCSDARGPCEFVQTTLCNIPQTAQVLRSENSEILAEMNAEWNFEVSGSGDGFDCATVTSVLTDLLLLIAPEFTLGDIEIGDAIEAGCME